MIVTSTTEAVPFTPSWREGEASPPTFTLRAGSVIERGQMEAELSGQYRAGRVFGFELRAAIVSGIGTLLADDPEQDRLLALLAVEGEGDLLTEDDQRLLTDARSVLAEHWPEYRDLLAQMERRREIAPIVALRRFCTGWENCANDKGVPAVFKRGLDGLVADVALSGLSALELMSAGNRAYGLQYAAGDEGNSSRPPLSGDGPQISTSDVSSKAAGKSVTIGGKKTRAPRSPRGSGRS
jgi:hypothetical protein